MSLSIPNSIIVPFVFVDLCFHSSIEIQKRIIFSEYMNFHIPSFSGDLKKNKEINASEYFRILKCYFELILRLVVQQNFPNFSRENKPSYTPLLFLLDVVVEPDHRQ